MSIIKLTISTDLSHAIDVPMMDVDNISKLILEYNKELFSYHTTISHPKYYTIYSNNKKLGYIPNNDSELLQRVEELVEMGWNNSNRRIRLDITSWRMKGTAIRYAIFTTL
jgi:hypothetical protein